MEFDIYGHNNTACSGDSGDPLAASCATVASMFMMASEMSD